MAVPEHDRGHRRAGAMSTAMDWLPALSTPACYPGEPADPIVLQTHISVVCLAGEFVYKLKKPVVLPFLDYSQLARRRFFCGEEVRLNRRLCPAVYLDVVPLLRTALGVRFGAADEAGDVVDWAVRMRRLPADRMLDRLMHERTVTPAAIAALARTVAAFHARADRGPAAQAAGDPDQLRAFALANFDEVAALPGHGLPTALLAALRAVTGCDFERILPRLRARADRGLVVDGHGDLHARNVCMTEPPAVYDCIEFSAAFRCGDVATENAFLLMDLRYRGAADLAAEYLRAYTVASDDREQSELLPALIRYRALVRTKVAALAAAEPELPAADRHGARASARAHLRLAAASAIEDHAPVWWVLCGPPASGKSALAHALAAHGWPVLATDVVRKELAGLPPTARADAQHYTPEFSNRTYAAVLARAASGAPVVVLDGNFPDAARRREAAAAAHARGARLLVLHVDVDAATALQRVKTRERDPAAVSDAGSAEFERLRARFRAPQAEEHLAVVRLDGGADVDAVHDAALAGALAALAPPQARQSQA